MTRKAFEELVDAWLAEPQRHDLRRQIDAAVAADPALAAVVEQWRRFDELLQRGCTDPRVHWDRLKEHILAAVSARDSADDELLDTALRTLPPVDARVHWPRFHARVMAAVSRGRIAAATRRRRYTRVVAGAATLLAAAAALFLAFLPRPVPVTGPVSIVRVQLMAPPANAGGVVSVHIVSAASSAASPERFFAVDPMPKPEASNETVGVY
jgi:hypothetical protein